MTALEVGVLSLAGGGIIASGFTVYHRSKKKQENNYVIIQNG
jgi:hypothetical protein